MFIQSRSFEFSKQIAAVLLLSFVTVGCGLSNFHTELPGGYFLVRTDTQSTQIFNPDFSGHPYMGQGKVLLDQRFELSDFTAFTYDLPGIAVPAQVASVGYEKQYVFGEVVRARFREWPANHMFSAPGYFILNTHTHVVQLGMDYSKFCEQLAGLNVSLQMAPAERVRPVTGKTKSKESGLIAAYVIRIHGKVSPIIGNVKSALLIVWSSLSLASVLVSIASVHAAVNKRGWIKRFCLGGFMIAVIVSIEDNFFSDAAILFAIQAMIVFFGVTMLQEPAVFAWDQLRYHAHRAVAPKIRFSLADAFKFVALSSLVLVLVKYQVRVLDVFVPLSFATIALTAWWCVIGNGLQKPRLSLLVMTCALGSIPMQIVPFMTPVLAVGCVALCVLQGMLLYGAFRLTAQDELKGKNQSHW